ncbi:MAG: hypothetical protein VCF08_19260, partial [Alphaproteobacteria bacterium]
SAPRSFPLCPYEQTFFTDFLPHRRQNPIPYCDLRKKLDFRIRVESIRRISPRKLRVSAAI